MLSLSLGPGHRMKGRAAWGLATFCKHILIHLTIKYCKAVIRRRAYYRFGFIRVAHAQSDKAKVELKKVPSPQVTVANSTPRVTFHFNLWLGLRDTKLQLALYQLFE